jgi:hypothetical protein
MKIALRGVLKFQEEEELRREIEKEQQGKFIAESELKSKKHGRWMAIIMAAFALASIIISVAI